MSREQPVEGQATGMPIRVVLIDDHWVFRLGLRALLQGSEDMEVVGEAADGQEALRLVRELNPEVLVLDMSMPGISGDEVARQLRSVGSPVQVLAVSAYADDQYVFGAVDSGVKGYLLKEDASTDLVAAVRGVAHGKGGWFSRPVMAKLAQRIQARSQPTATSGSNPTPREQDVLRLVAEGLRNREIAERLVTTERTVRFHLANLFAKLEATSRTELVCRAREHGWLP